MAERAEPSRDALVVASLRVIAGDGRIARDADGTAWLEQAKVGTSVLSSDAAKQGAAASMLSTRDKTPLPWLIVDSRQRPNGNAWRTARPFLKLARAIEWEPASHRHVARFLLGLDAENGAPGPLTNPLRARLAVSCDDVVPADVIFNAVGPAGDQTIEVACSPKVKNERERQSLSILMASGSLDYPFEIPRRPGPFELVSSAQNVLGLGIGSLQLTLIRSEEDGTPLPVSNGLNVPLQSLGGEVEPSQIIIPKGESQATINVRPRGVGTLQLSAGTSAEESAKLSVELSWPLYFLLVTLIGGALGGYLSASRQREIKPRRRRSWAYTARRALEGALVGLVALSAMLTLPGMAIVPDALRTSEIGWFVGSVLAGFAGTELVETLSGLLFRKKDQPAVPASSN
jgi:hypothetical protein